MSIRYAIIALSVMSLSACGGGGTIATSPDTGSSATTTTDTTTTDTTGGSTTTTDTTGGSTTTTDTTGGSTTSSTGGSTSGSTTTVDAGTTFADVPTDGAYSVVGTGQTTTYVTDTFSRTTVDASSDGQDVTGSQTNAGGSAVASSIGAGGVTFTADSQNGGTLDTSTPGVISITAADGATIVRFYDPSSTGYSYQTYGFWTKANTDGSVSQLSASIGVQNNTVLPTGTSATYRGTSSGIELDSFKTLQATTSTIKITTDFSTATIASSGSKHTVFKGSTTYFDAPELDFTGTGTVSGNGFTAAISGSTLTSGSSTVKFYGPNAEEAGGTFVGSGGTVAHYVGAFGAKR